MKISPNVWSKFQNDSDVTTIFNDLNKVPCFFKVDKNKSERYSKEKQYIKCSIPVYVLSFFKKLFVSTLVYDAACKKIPTPESVTFKFDTKVKTVSITGLNLYRPNNDPFYIYARNAASSLSIEAIGLENYCIDNMKDVKDFYNLREMSHWKEVSQLNSEIYIEDKSGIYMLYDCNNNDFYVGKAIRLKERMMQHNNNVTGNDPISNFTHYRYSVFLVNTMNFCI